MDAPRYSLLRDILAVVIAAAACPVAVFGGTNLSCVGQTFTSDCALTAVFISPVILLAAGVLTGVVTRGWTGLLLVCIGTLIGMLAILAFSSVAGRPVPLDPASAIIATIWFLAPLSIGYAIGRMVMRILASDRERDEEDEPDR